VGRKIVVAWHLDREAPAAGEEARDQPLVIADPLHRGVREDEVVGRGGLPAGDVALLEGDAGMVASRLGEHIG
jgi:hypothetical protein